LNKADKWTYKQEYEKFKFIVTCIALVSSLVIWSLTSRYRAFDALFHFLLVWYYCTLTIRESILIVNGSNINRKSTGDAERMQRDLSLFFRSLVESPSFYCNGCHGNSLDLARIGLLRRLSDPVLHLFLLFKLRPSKHAHCLARLQCRSSRAFNSTINAVVSIVCVLWARHTTWTSPSKVSIVGCFVSLVKRRSIPLSVRSL
jgi:TMPIT-like protein